MPGDWLFGWPQAIVLLVALQRVGELLYARHNQRHLLANGGIERGRSHYPWMVALHASWLATLLLVVRPAAPIDLWWLAVFLLMQAGRVWVIATLGRFWTTRVITLPDAALIAHGPYRFCRHPNYAIVVGEIAVLPLVFGAWQIALVFSLLNAAVLVWRIRIETAALAQRPKATVE